MKELITGNQQPAAATASPLLAFYLGSHPDNRGRTLAEVLRQDDFWLEVTHDYIQWLFPLAESSRVNPQAPLVDAITARTFAGDELLRRHLMAAFVRMLKFFGLQRGTNGEVSKAVNWSERKGDWFNRDSHNSLRITRILKSLALLGLPDEAREFQRALANLCRTEPDCDINRTSQAFWRDAISDHSD